MVEHPVDDVERLALQLDAVVIGKVVDAAAQYVVFRNDLLNVKTVIQALQAMHLGTVFNQRFRNGLVGILFEGQGQFVQQAGNVVVERGRIQVPGRRKFPHLVSPACEQALPFAFNQSGQFDHFHGCHSNSRGYLGLRAACAHFFKPLLSIAARSRMQQA